ncbi:hypothetical protein C2S52_011716 [Perilla frutescens var. hirtella]|nr:hypothetical protein C2S52_011716 [Perilla frutescens var. hirtella]
MKDCQKRWKPDRTSSLLAMFMGLDELRPQPPVHEKRRGLSESYIRNAASIGLRRGSLVSVGRSCSTNNELVSGVQVSKSKSDKSSHRLLNSRTSIAKNGLRNSVSLFGASYESRKSIGKNDEHCAKYVLKRQHKLEHDSFHLGELVSPRHRCIACSRNMNSIPQQERCRSKFEAVLEPRYRSYSHHPRNLLDLSSLANESKKQNLRRWKRAKKVQEFGASGRNQNLNQILALADCISKPRNLDVKPCKTGLCNPTSLLSRSSDSSSLDIRDDESLQSQPVSEFEAVKDILSLTQYESIAIENNSEKQTTSHKDVLEFKSGRGSDQFQASLGVDEIMSPDSKVSELSSCSFSCFGSTFNDPEAYILGIRDEMDNSLENDSGKDNEPSATVGDSSRTSGDPESELNPGTVLVEGGQSSAVEEVFTREASLNEYFEEESPYSNFSAIGPPASLENLKRTSLHSPDSVLEPYYIKNSSSFECFDSTGLRLQLESLNFESGDPYSEGSVMVISGDEDAEEQFGDLSHDSRKVKRWLGDGESRNFSYMVDVLDEAGFCGMNSYMDFKMWHSLECPISPLAFEALEKKYGKQTSWESSERQLLFDCINSGLLEIFNPIVNFHAGTTSVRRRFSASFRLDEVVDELWMKLVSQEKEKSKELYKKALDKWLELEEGIDIVCRELEASLFDELAMEFW